MEFWVAEVYDQGGKRIQVSDLYRSPEKLAAIMKEYASEFPGCSVFSLRLWCENELGKGV